MNTTAPALPASELAYLVERFGAPAGLIQRLWAEGRKAWSDFDYDDLGVAIAKSEA